MQPIDRRAFLRALSGAAVTATFAKSIEKAVATPANYRTGTIDDIEHIVFLMQENRAFDHYFGTLRGVRGYGDPRVATLPSGKPVWYQPDGSGYVLPYHPTADNFGDAFLVDTAHGWNDTQKAWNGGKYDQWIPTKSRATMAYYTRKDIPFHYALADAFTSSPAAFLIGRRLTNDSEVPLFYLAFCRFLPYFSRHRTEGVSMTKSRVSVIAAGIGALALFALASGADAQTAKTGRTAISKECSAKADEQKLTGKPRRAFRSKCIRDSKKKPA